VAHDDGRGKGDAASPGKPAIPVSAELAALIARKAT
jgi:hypothetical protein